jgi:pimeloyl-ACP methyl ester carboxylesterase
MEKTIEFFSKGVKLRGVLNMPEGNGPHPLLVMAGGWCYVKEIVMPTYAAELAAVGCATLRFDYRGLGDSDGEPRQHLDPWAQIEDYRNALSFAAGLPGVDKERLGVWGISYSGGHGLILAAIDARVKCSICNIPVIDGYESMRLVHGYGMGRFAALTRLIADDREKRARGEAGGFIPHNSSDPNTEICTWPFTTSYAFFSGASKTFAPNYQGRSTIESTEMLMQYSVYDYLKRIYFTPVQMLIVEGDEHTPWDLQVNAYNQIGSVRKELAVMTKATHIGLYAKLDFQVRAAKRNSEFVKKHLVLQES